MVTMEDRVRRLESDVYTLQHSVNELDKDIAESEDRQMTALADLKTEMNCRMDRLEQLLHIVIQVLYVSLGRDSENETLRSLFDSGITAIPGGEDILAIFQDRNDSS